MKRVKFIKAKDGFSASTDNIACICMLPDAQADLYIEQRVCVLLPSAQTVGDEPVRPSIKMRRIKFIGQVNAGTPEDRRTYAAASIHTLPAGEAEEMLARGVAEDFPVTVVGDEPAQFVDAKPANKAVDAAAVKRK